MIRRCMTREQLETLRQYSGERREIELRERRNLLGRVDSIGVLFLNGDVGTAYRESFACSINTSRNAQFRDVADDITSLLYTPRTGDTGDAVHRAYAEEQIKG
jgi:hypothetical protein